MTATESRTRSERHSLRRDGCRTAPRLTLLLALGLQLAGVRRAGAQAQTYHVRPDGGSCEECTGLADAPYPGTGLLQPCAWDHPFRALPPGGPPRIAGGDTLLIHSGDYRMGYGAPGADACHFTYSWDCFMCALPSGPDPEHPTRILGVLREGEPPPELWGCERALTVLNLTGASNVEIGWLEITDHSGCVEFHSAGGGTTGWTCVRDTPPFGDWASTGLYAEDSAGVHLHHLDIHGLASTGVWAGRLHDWTVEHVRLAGNGWAGWNGDIYGDDANSGRLLFRHWIVEWNGCAESWPEGEPEGCWAQTAGGYGDGVGTGPTGGEWVIEDSAFLHNTSDGLDLLYIQPGGSTRIRRTRAEGNAGNQVKISGPARVENSVIVGHCGFFAGQPFTLLVDDCRALGTALALNLRPGDGAEVVNCTIASEGDCLVTAECDGACTGSERVYLRNNILVGAPDFLQAWDESCLIYQETFPSDPFDIDHSVIFNVKHDRCPGPHAICDVDPGLVDPRIDSFDARLLPTSPAIAQAAPAAAPAHDLDGWPRDAHPDIGAYEWHSWQADSDGDGFTDWTEHRLGTDPFAAQPWSDRPRIERAELAAAGPAPISLRVDPGVAGPLLPHHTSDRPLELRLMRAESLDQLLAQQQQLALAIEEGTAPPEFSLPQRVEEHEGRETLLFDATPTAGSSRQFFIAYLYQPGPD